jgi:hypothetical protein
MPKNKRTTAKTTDRSHPGTPGAVPERGTAQAASRELERSGKRRQAGEREAGAPARGREPIARQNRASSEE